MKKFFLIFLYICVSLAEVLPTQSTNEKDWGDTQKKSAKIIDGIAIKVNGEPITLYQIKDTEKKLKLDRQKAIDKLIAEKIKVQEIKRLNIHIDDARVDQEIDNIAKHNGLNHDSFLSALMQQGINFTQYKNQLKEQIETQELLRSILLSDINTTGETQMRNYYNKHEKEFHMPKEVEVIRYVSKDTQALQRAISNPMTKTADVEKGEEKISLDTLNPQIAQIFVQNDKSTFTPILNAGDGNFVSFYIKEKIGQTQIPFNQAKNFIAQKLAEENQDRVLEEYFEKIRVKAKISFIRE